MECKYCRERMLDYLRQRLNADDAQAFDLHLSQCPDCRWEIDQHRRLDQLLDTWQVPPAQPGFERHLNMKLEKETASWWQRWLHQIRRIFQSV